MTELVKYLAKALVDHPDQVEVRSVESEHGTTLHLKVAESDLGKVIGRQGRTARSLRAIVGAAGFKQRRRVGLEIEERSRPERQAKDRNDA